MIDVTYQCTARLEVIGVRCALVYIHLGWNDGKTREGAIGFFNLQGFHPMAGAEEKVKVTAEDFGWFRVEIDPGYYISHMEKFGIHPEPKSRPEGSPVCPQEPR